jgi:hypothetical protein
MQHAHPRSGRKAVERAELRRAVIVLQHPDRPADSEFGILLLYDGGVTSVCFGAAGRRARPKDWTVCLTGHSRAVARLASIGPGLNRLTPRWSWLAPVMRHRSQPERAVFRFSARCPPPPVCRAAIGARLVRGLPMAPNRRRFRAGMDDPAGRTHLNTVFTGERIWYALATEIEPVAR